jgi:hypothetical protein
MAIKTVVGDEELTARSNRLLVSLVGVFQGYRFHRCRKSRRQILRVLDETQAIARYKKLTAGFFR